MPRESMRKKFESHVAQDGKNESVQADEAKCDGMKWHQSQQQQEIEVFGEGLDRMVGKARESRGVLGTMMDAVNATKEPGRVQCPVLPIKPGIKTQCSDGDA
jgi:hypothetical protein